MPFTILVLLTAFLIESIGTYVSVLGLASLFSANPIIIALAIALDLGKVVSVSFLYKKWQKINLVMKSYMTIAAIVLMGITSAGAFGFLSGEFQKAISGTNEQNVVIQTLEQEQTRLQKRKEQIDKQISQLPENMVRGRTQLMRQFAPEVNRINERLAEIDKQLPALKVESIKKNVEVGPIIYISEAFNTTPEHAVKWVILIIIFVFDPLAIALLLAGNYLIEERKALKEKKDESEKIEKEVEIPPVVEAPIPEPIVVAEVQAIAPEPKIEEPIVEELPREKKSPSKVIIDKSAKPVRSSLEDIVARDNIDIQQDTDVRSNMSELRRVYQDKN